MNTAARRKLRAEELITNLSTRQSSTLVIATVASSGSLALLALSSNPMPLPLVEKLAGLFFPVAGLLYRQLTTLSDHVDRETLDRMRGKLNHPRPDIWIIRFRKMTLISLLASPSALWALQIFDNPLKLWIAVSLLGMVPFLVAIEDRGFREGVAKTISETGDGTLQSLIERVDREFKSSRIPRSLWPWTVAVFLPFILAFQLSLIFDFVPGFIFTATGTAFLALILSNISVGLTLLAFLYKQLPRAIINYNFARMRRIDSTEQNPILYALISLKTSAPRLNLADSYRLRAESFDNESLLKRIYGPRYSTDE